MGLRQFIGKHEFPSVIFACLLLSLPLAWSFASLFGMIGDSYQTVFVGYSMEASGLLVEENYDIVASRNYNVLYKSFDDPICLREGCRISIQKVVCRSGVGYFSESSPSVAALSVLDANTGAELIIPDSLKSKFQSNEVGCFLPDGYRKTTEEMKITYIVSAEPSDLGMHDLFSREHFAIRKLIVQGVEKSSVKHLIQKNKEIRIDTRDASIEIKGMPIWIWVFAFVVLAVIPLLIWQYFGKEKSFVVPSYLHTIPQKDLEPWMLDVLVNGTWKISKNGVAALLLEAHVKGILKTETDKSSSAKTVFRIRKDFEKVGTEMCVKLLKIIQRKQASEDGQYFVCEIQRDDQSVGRGLYQLMHGSAAINDVVNEHMKSKGQFVFYAVSAASLFIGQVIYKEAGMIFFLYPVFLFLIAFVYPASVFSSFKGDNYRLYLEWIAFGNMLVDYAQIKKYLREDYSQWKEWLLYGTALGKADNLLKSMKELHILKPVDADQMRNTYTGHILLATLASSRSSSRGSGGFGGGGFGGGGFGGGGGGGR